MAAISKPNFWNAGFNQDGPDSLSIHSYNKLPGKPAPSLSLASHTCS